jgi:hypothetical protein
MIDHLLQGKWLTMLKAQWSPNPDVYPHFTVGSTLVPACVIADAPSQIGDLDHSLDIFGCKGEFLAKLSDKDRYWRSPVCSRPSFKTFVQQGLGHTSGDVFPPQRC